VGRGISASESEQETVSLPRDVLLVKPRPLCETDTSGNLVIKKKCIIAAEEVPPDGRKPFNSFVIT